jgi:uncharacterized protein YidB (DUF937 family)
MSNDFLSRVLGSVLGDSAGAQAGLGGSGGGLGGLGNLLGGLLGGRAAANDAGAPAAGKGAMLAVLLPLAIQLIQRNGGVGGLLQRLTQGGYGQQAQSWVSTGENQPVGLDAVTDIMGADELSRLSQQLGVPSEQVAGGLAEILPHVVDQLTPQGQVPADADDVLGSSLSQLTQAFGQQR